MGNSKEEEEEELVEELIELCDEVWGRVLSTHLDVDPIQGEDKDMQQHKDKTVLRLMIDKISKCFDQEILFSPSPPSPSSSSAAAAGGLPQGIPSSSPPLTLPGAPTSSPYSLPGAEGAYTAASRNTAQGVSGAGIFIHA